MTLTKKEADAKLERMKANNPDKNIEETTNLQIRVVQIGTTDNIEIYSDGKYVGLSELTEDEKSVLRDIVEMMD